MNESDEFYRAIFESAAQGIVVVNAAGRIVLVNSAMESLFGYDPGEMTGLSLDLLVPAAIRERHVAQRTEYFSHPRQRPMGVAKKLEGVRKDGQGFPVEVSLGFARTSEGGLAFGFVADVSDRERLERKAQRDSQRMRALTAQLLSAQEDERRRIARELHDRFTQDIASVAIELGLLRKRQEAAALNEPLAHLQQELSQLSEQVRLLAHEFHSGVLEHSGIAAALDAHCREVARQSGLAVYCRQRDLPAEIPREIAVTLYRIAQEALRNVVKHAGASQVDVLLAGGEVESGRSTLRLVVMDNGKGFMIEDVRDGSGLGLLSIEERARQVQATLTISSVPGEGTRVTVEAPL